MYKNNMLVMFLLMSTIIFL